LMRLASDARSWQHHEFALSEYAGKTVTLRFSVYNDGLGGRAAMYLDDVTLEACWGAVPPTPTVTPSPVNTAHATATPASTVGPGPTPGATPTGPAYVVRTVGVGRHPHGVGVDPATGLVYVANYLGGTVSVVDAVAGTVAAEVSLGGATGSNGIAINPALRRAYVANSFSDDVAIVDLDERRLLSTVPVREAPDGVAVDYASDDVYVACFGSGTVSVIDEPTGAVKAEVPVGMEPAMIAVAPRRGEIYVTNHHHLFNSVAVIDSGSQAEVGRLSTGGGPYGVAFNAREDIIYTANRDGFSVSAISRGGTRLAEIPLGSSVYVVAYNDNTDHLFAVCAGENRAYVIDGTSFEVLAALPVGSEAEEGIAIDKATNRVYVANGGDDSITVIQDVGSLPSEQYSLLPLVLKDFAPSHATSVESCCSGEGATAPRQSGEIESVGVPIPGLRGVSAVAVDALTGASYYAGDGGLVKLEGGNQKQRGWCRSCPALVDVEVDSGRVFATSWEAGALLVFDASDGALLLRVEGFVRPSGLAVGLGRIFVADTGADCLVVLDEESCGIMQSLPVDRAPALVALDEVSGRVYVSSLGDGVVAAFDARTGQGISRVSLGGLGYPQGMDVDAASGRVFVAYSVAPREQAVQVLDGRNLELISRFPLNGVEGGSGVYAVAFDDRLRTLVLSSYGALLVMDGDMGEVLWQRPRVGAESPFGLALDVSSGEIFVADLDGGPVRVMRPGLAR